MIQTNHSGCSHTFNPDLTSCFSHLITLCPSSHTTPTESRPAPVAPLLLPLHYTTVSRPWLVIHRNASQRCNIMHSLAMPSMEHLPKRYPVTTLDLPPNSTPAWNPAKACGLQLGRLHGPPHPEALTLPMPPRCWIPDPNPRSTLTLTPPTPPESRPAPMAPLSLLLHYITVSRPYLAMPRHPL